MRTIRREIGRLSNHEATSTMNRDDKEYRARPAPRNCRLLVCARTSRWVAALRPRLDGYLDLAETRSPRECLNALAEAPASLVAWESNVARLSEAIEALGEMERRYPLARLVALCDEVSAQASAVLSEEWLREAGAVHVVRSPLDAEVIVKLARRHAARLPEARRDWAERVWEELPWRPARASG